MLTTVVLLFVLWYCHKRGREVRLESQQTVDGGDRIEELEDDPALPAPETDASSVEGGARRNERETDVSAAEGGAKDERETIQAER